MDDPLWPLTFMVVCGSGNVGSVVGQNVGSGAGQS